MNDLYTDMVLMATMNDIQHKNAEVMESIKPQNMKMLIVSIVEVQIIISFFFIFIEIIKLKFMDEIQKRLHY